MARRRIRRFMNARQPAARGRPPAAEDGRRRTRKRSLRAGCCLGYAAYGVGSGTYTYTLYRRSCPMRCPPSQWSAVTYWLARVSSVHRSWHGRGEAKAQGAGRPGGGRTRGEGERSMKLLSCNATGRPMHRAIARQIGHRGHGVSAGIVRQGDSRVPPGGGTRGHATGATR